jgi:hypothetical protein
MRSSSASLDKPLDPTTPLRVVIADDHVKLGLPAEPAAHRRVMAVLAFLEDPRAETSRA